MQSSSSSPPNAATSSSVASSIVKRLFLLTSVILRILLWPLLKLSSILFPAKEFDGVTNTRALDAAARAFSSFFQSNYLPASSNSTINPFENMGYNKCITDATRQNKCVLIYLHSPLHRDSNSFCHNVLASSAIQTLIQANQHMLTVWGGSIHTADGAQVAKLLHVTKYPFVALVACQQGRTR